MKNVIISILIIVLIIAGIFGVYYLRNRNTEKTSDLTEIKLNEVTRSVFYAPQYVAISKGFFKDEGLKLDITTGQGAERN